jgi:hypothetical protein
MAAPVVTPPQYATGFKMPDGYSSRFVFKNKPTISLWELTVKPPGFDGGDLIDNTSMQNKKWRTRRVRHLITLTESSMVAYYDPDMFNDLIAQLNAEQAISQWWPDGSALAFYGALIKADFAELKEGEPPTVNCTIGPTNWDPAAGVEADPVFQPAAGT